MSYSRYKITVPFLFVFKLQREYEGDELIVWKIYSDSGWGCFGCLFFLLLPCILCSIIPQLVKVFSHGAF